MALSSKQKIKEYADFFGMSTLDAYFDLVDMGEVRESDTLRRWATKGGE